MKFTLMIQSKEVGEYGGGERLISDSSVVARTGELIGTESVHAESGLSAIDFNERSRLLKHILGEFVAEIVQ